MIRGASDKAAMDAVRTLLSWLGEDPDRPGLVETPARVLAAWGEAWGRGYQRMHPHELIKLFDPERGQGQSYNQMVVQRDITCFSHCEHHMTPFFGVAHLAYVPDARGLVGLSKLARVVDHFARRLTVQERLTEEIADFLQTHLSPHIGVTLDMRHFCMISRGVGQPRSSTITTALRGNLFDDASARAEYLRAITPHQGNHG
jgi:GTP cyclohydrolase I